MHHQGAAHRLRGTLRTFRALADPASGADRGDERVRQVEPARVDELAGVFQRAAEPDGEVAVVPAPIAGTGPPHRAGQREVALGVGRLDDLGDDPPRVAETRVDVQRGQAPEKRAKGKLALAKRLDTLPAGSMRSMKKGMPRALGRLSVVSRWQVCSKLTPKRDFTRAMS